MSKTVYKVLGEFGVFMPLSSKNLAAALNYPANSAMKNFNAHFEQKHLNQSNAKTVRAIGKAGVALSGMNMELSYGLFNELKTKISNKTPQKKGTFLFVAVFAIKREGGQAIDLKTVDLVPAASPQNTARVLSKCDTGEINCASIAPLNNAQINVSAYILAKVL